MERVRTALAAVPGGGNEELEAEWSQLQTQSTYRQLLAVTGVSANALAWSGLEFTKAAYLPETVVDTALRALFKKELFVTSDEGVEKFNPDSALLLWTAISKEASKKDCDSATLNEYFVKWTSALKALYDKLVYCWIDYRETEAPRDNNVVLLLSQWASLRFRRIPISGAFAEERRLAAKLASTGEDGSPTDTSISLNFKIRRKNLALIIRSCKATADQNGVLDLARRIETKASSDTECISLVQEYTRANGFSDIDRFFGTERFDFTKDDDSQQGSKHGAKRHNSSPTASNRSKRSRHGHDSSGGSADSSRPSGAGPGPLHSAKPTDPLKFSNDVRGNGEKSAHPTLSEKLKVSSSVLQQRRQAGSCLGCGASDHKLAACPKYVSLNKTTQKSDAGKIEAKKAESSAYFACVVQSVNGSRRVLRLSVLASHPDILIQRAPVRLGIDSYSACSLVSVALVQQLSLASRTLHDPVRLVLADTSLSVIERETSIRLDHGGHNAVIECLIVDSLPEADMIIGYPDFSLMGIQVSVPPASGSLQGGIHSDVDTQVRAALLYLTSRLDKWEVCPGARGYRYRLRRLQPSEIRDTSEQTVTLEVEIVTRGAVASGVPIATDSKGEQPKPFDYSIGLYQALSEQSRADYLSEIRNFVDHKWWVPITSSIGDDPLVSETEIITFPSCQKETKSTRVRACSDARRLNQETMPASYQGLSIEDILRFARARWDPSSSTMFVLDLRKAFYKIRIAHGKRIKVRTINCAFLSDRIIFGLRIGPSILSAQVCILCSAVLSGILGRPINIDSVHGLVDVVSGLVILPYYDDLLVIGNEDLARRFVDVICRVAPYLGGEFPAEKRLHLVPGASMNHLGLHWHLSKQNMLTLSCNPPNQDDPCISRTVSKRAIFGIAGLFHDPTYGHVEARLVADYLRSWAGKIKASWDKRFPLSEDQSEALGALVSRGKADFRTCSHKAIPKDHSYLIGYTDACDIGGGCCLLSASTPNGRPHDSDVVLLEAHSKLFDPAERRWHVNRKEYFWLHRTLRLLLKWVSKFPPSSHQIQGVSLYCDNAAATAWSTTAKPRKYDIQAVARLYDEITELLDQCRNDLGIQASIVHLPGSLNVEADRLSRLGSTLESLAPLEVASVEPKPRKTHKDFKTMISCVVVTEGHDCALSAPDPGDLDPRLELFPVAALSTLPSRSTSRHRALYPSIRSLMYRFMMFCKPYMELKVSRLRSGFAWGGAVQGPRLQLQDGLIQYRDKQVGSTWKVYLPTTRSRSWALYYFHSNLLRGGHRGAPRAIDAVQAAGYWWPTMSKDMNRWIRSCPDCQLGKWYEPYNPQPLVFRRGMNRFAAIQLDFAGPMSSHAKPTDTPCPGDSQYLLVIIDEGTRASMVLPAVSTSALDVILGLLVWFQCYGVPDHIQLDGAGAHVSDELANFAKIWNFHLSIGIARRPQTQGLVEGLVRDIKCGVQTNRVSQTSLPWYVAALGGAIVHNQSFLLGTKLSPQALAVGADLDASLTPEQVSNIIADRYAHYRQLRDERAASAEIHDLLTSTPRYVFGVGDRVRLVRMINHRRCIQGPFEVEAVHPTNHYLFLLQGKSGYVSIGQLLPYRQDAFIDSFSHAVLPHQALLTQLTQKPMPDGVAYLDIQPGNWVFVIREVSTESSEPNHDLSVSLVETVAAGALHVVGLDRHRNGSWHPPRSRRFTCTAQRRIPKPIKDWLSAQGVSL
ncbi:hypothetical protein FOZ62_002741 [Perkinsus olseni]|uniref:Integrase catalytic domain-containing protein n=1 Tax=Perkinsus olseni TaxID=32597 RepID=A0A7J6SMQ4_PEROL|nr:hypothetical protein FOZ62_002741 [Perkinsus olseni]